MRRLKVLHFIPGSGVGGIERFVMDITSEQLEGIEYDFIVFARGESAFVDCIRQRGNVYTFTGWSMNTLKKTHQIMKKNNYDVVHAHLGCWSFLILCLARLCGVKKRIAHSHSADGFSDMSSSGKVMFLLSKVGNPLCVTNYFACSDHACECTFGKNKTKSRKYTRVLNPVDFNRVRTCYDVDEEKLKKELGIRKGCRIVCNVGYLGKHKNQMFLLKLAQDPRLSDVEFLFVGDGWNREKLENTIKESNIKNVHLTGVRNDIPSILKISDVFVLPSILEGLGTVVLEAQACGTPSIISENVTKETDLGMGLVQQIPLSDEESWINEMIGVEKPELTEEEIMQCFIENNVELSSTIQLIESIYKG